jgi:hypothetical protein
MYTHVVIASPDLVHERLLLRSSSWGELQLVGETRTAQATVLIYETEHLLGGIEVNEMIDTAPEIWHFDGNFSRSRHQQRLISF